MWVTTRAQGGVVILTVENIGERLGPSVVATLAEPFPRGTGRTRTHRAGVGLDPAIVDSITRAHDGTLTLSARPTRGLHRAGSTRPARRAVSRRGR